MGIIRCKVTISRDGCDRFELRYTGFGVGELERMWADRLGPGETCKVEQVI